MSYAWWNILNFSSIYMIPIFSRCAYLMDTLRMFLRPICQRRLKQLNIFHGIQKSPKRSSLNFSGHWTILKEALAYMCGALCMCYIWISGKGSINVNWSFAGSSIFKRTGQTLYLALSRGKELTNYALSGLASGTLLSGRAGPPWKRDGLKWNWVGGVKWKYSVEMLHFSMLASQVSQ